MRKMLRLMSTPKNSIPTDVLSLFDSIRQACEVATTEKLKDELGENFRIALEEHLTEEQLFRLWEQAGSCQSTEHDKKRRAFALEHASKPLAERLELFCKNFSRSAVLNADNTITVSFPFFKCCDIALNEHSTRPPASYIGRCAGGRLYEYQKALGIKLKIKSITPPSQITCESRFHYTFEIVGGNL